MDTQTPDVVFNAFVHLTDDAGHHHAFGPGDPVPGWARPQVGDHVIGTGYVPFEPYVEDPADLIPQAPGFTAFDDDDLGVVEPPKAPPTSGPGSGQAAWVQFARACGETEVTGTWTRQDVIDLLVRHGHLIE